jgi:hypothetical protein
MRNPFRETCYSCPFWDGEEVSAEETQELVVAEEALKDLHGNCHVQPLTPGKGHPRVEALDYCSLHPGIQSAIQNALMAQATQAGQRMSRMVVPASEVPSGLRSKG